MSRADRLFDSFDFDGSQEAPEVFGRYRGWAMGLGILLMIVGLFAALNAFYATMVTIFMIAAMLIIGGIVQGVQAFVSRRGKSFAIHMLMAILYLVVGFLMFNRPVASALGITLLMAAFFIAGGTFRFIAASVARFEKWGWVAFSGALGIILGFLVFYQWPFSALWILGLYVGIDLFFIGMSLTMLAAAAKGSERDNAPRGPRRSIEQPA